MFQQTDQHFWYPLESSLFFHNLSDYDSKKLVQSDSVFRTIFADEKKTIIQPR